MNKYLKFWLFWAFIGSLPMLAIVAQYEGQPEVISVDMGRYVYIEETGGTLGFGDYWQDLVFGFFLWVTVGLVITFTNPDDKRRKNENSITKQRVRNR